MPVTQRQLAEHLGLSPQAVSFALGSRQDQVSHKTRQRVVDAAKKLGYRSNAAAKAMATGRFNAVGLVMSEHNAQSTLYGQTLRGINAALSPRGIHLNITFVTDEQLTSDTVLPSLLSEVMVDGLVLNYTHDIPEKMIDLVDRHAIPAVWLNARRDHNCVHLDDRGAAAEATQRLLDQGHRELLFLDTTAKSERSGEVHYSHAERQAGFIETVRASGLAPVTLTPKGWWGDKGITKLAELLASPAKPSAVLCYSGHEATLVELACERLGLKLGHDLALICFDADRGPGVIFTRMNLPERELGHAAGEMLLELLDDTADQPCRPIPMPFYAGETFSPPLASSDAVHSAPSDDS